MWVSKVIPLNISKVMVLRNLLIWDLLRVLVFFLPLLSIVECYLELFVSGSAKMFSLLIDASFTSDVSLYA